MSNYLRGIPITSVAQGLPYCNGCGECCRDPCLLKPADVAPIAAHLGLAPAEFVTAHLDFIPLKEKGFVFNAVRPKRRADGWCHFLGDDKRCAIHAVKPWGGKDFECWTPERYDTERDLQAWWQADDLAALPK